MKTKHIFIINPVAGKHDKTEYIKSILKDRNDIDYEIYNTSKAKDATVYAKEMCKQNPEMDLRFYACGGDGTVNEVVSGIVGYPNASFTVYPCGSGNDFIKATKDKDFTDINALIDGEEKLIDVLKINSHYSINIINIGFDAAVSYNMVKFKNWPLVSGKMAYNLALVYSLIKEMKHKAKIYADDELIYDGDFLLTAACNGICCGGAYYFAPKAKLDDGLMDQLVVKKMSRLRFIRYVKNFKTGNYENYPKIMEYLSVNKVKKIKVVSEKELVYGFDGESDLSKTIDIEVMNKAIRFFMPRNTKNLDKS